MLNGIGGRTIAEAQDRLSESEFESWAAFFQMYPFDDLHRFHRPAAMIATAFGGKYQQWIDFLAPDPLPPGMTQADYNTMRAFGMNPREAR